MPSLTEQKTGRPLLLILAVAILLRVALALTLGDTTPPGKDETSYFTLGARVAAGHGFTFDRPWYPFTPAETPTAHWSFLYALIVAAVYTVAGPHPLAVRLVSAVLSGLLLPWLTYRLAVRVTAVRVTAVRGQGSGDRGQESEARSSASCLLPPASCLLSPASCLLPPVLAAALAAVYPYFILYGAMIQTEAFYICALLWSLERTLALEWQIANGKRQTANLQSAIRNLQSTILLGLSLGIATLFRQSVLPWVAVLFAWLLYAGWRAGRLRQMIVAVSASTLALALCLAPFTVRNYRVYGNFLLLNSNAGYAMYSAQHPMHGVSFQEFAAAPLPDDLLRLNLNEAQWDKALMQRGIGFVLAEPGRYLRLSLSRVPDYFEFWPKPGTSLVNNIGRVASFGLFLPFMLYGIYLEVKAKVKAQGGYFSASALTLTLAFVIFYSALHILTWAMPRYRLPVDAVLLIFAAAGLADLLARLASRTRQRARPEPQPKP
ncbi:MAG: hypothetical protein NT169_22250 [Chloroflexi bacterium]|nr:hypothetical protein [Chloroflexota bacterium]